MKRKPEVLQQPPAIDDENFEHIKNMPCDPPNYPSNSADNSFIAGSGFFVVIQSKMIDFVIERFNTKIGASTFVQKLHPYHDLPIAITSRPRKWEPVFETEDLCIGIKKV